MFSAGRYALIKLPIPSFPTTNFERGLRSDLFIGLVLFVDNQKPVKYLFPSTVWSTPSQLFTNTAVQHNEYGISVNKKTFADLAEYEFDKQLIKL